MKRLLLLTLPTTLLPMEKSIPMGDKKMTNLTHHVNLQQKTSSIPLDSFLVELKTLQINHGREAIEKKRSELAALLNDPQQEGKLEIKNKIAKVDNFLKANAIVDAVRLNIQLHFNSEMQPYKDKVNTLLIDMREQGLFNPVPSPEKAIEYRNVFVDCMTTFLSRFNPVTQFKEMIDMAKFFCVLDFQIPGVYSRLHEEMKRADSTRQFFQSFRWENIAGMTKEQIARFISHIAGDMVFFKAVPASIGFLKEVGTTGAAGKGVASAISQLEHLNSIMIKAPSAYTNGKEVVSFVSTTAYYLNNPEGTDVLPSQIIEDITVSPLKRANTVRNSTIYYSRMRIGGNWFNVSVEKHNKDGKLVGFFTSPHQLGPLSPILGRKFK